MPRIQVTTALILVLTLALPLQADPPPGLQAVAALMSGSFASTAQAAADDEFLDIRLHVQRIWPDRNDGLVWLYVEQAVATSPDKPYRQRVYRLSPASTGEVASAVFELPGDPLVFAGAWKEPARFETLRPEDLVERAGCVVFLRHEGDARYSGSTRARECGSSHRGASYATTEVSLTPESMTSWDRGYDADGNQVWGSTKGAYVFDRLEN